MTENERALLLSIAVVASNLCAGRGMKEVSEVIEYLIGKVRADADTVR